MTPVGIAYTRAVVSAAVAVYSRVTPPNVRASVGAMSCFAVGFIAYTMLVTLDAVGVAVVAAYVAPLEATECVAPTGTVAEPKLHTNVACRLSVTIEPPSAPALVTATVADAGNAYIALAATVADAVVRVETNVNVNVVAALVAVTDAPRILLAARVAPSVAVVAGTVASVSSALVVAPAANEPSAELIALTEWLNVNCVSAAYDATRAYALVAIVATATVSGTANAVWPLVAITFVAPDGAVTVTRNSRLPVVEPTAIEVTAIVFVALVYVYDATPPATSALPT